MITKVKYVGTLFSKGGIDLKPRMLAATERIGQVVKASAQSDYLKKKKSSPKMPSLIIDNFTYDVPLATNTEVRAVVFTGGPEEAGKAYWAKWVDKGHALRDGKWWKGYNFMKVGADEGRKQAVHIVNDAMSKQI